MSDVRLEQLKDKYAESIKYIADGVFGRIKKGQSVALISPSYVGKGTTLTFILDESKRFGEEIYNVIQEIVPIWVVLDYKGTDPTDSIFRDLLNHVEEVDFVKKLQERRGNWGLINDVVAQLLKEGKKKVVFIIVNGEFLYRGYRNIESSITRLNIKYPSEVQFIVFCDEELPDSRFLRTEIPNMHNVILGNLFYMRISVEDDEFESLTSLRVFEAGEKIDAEVLDKIKVVSGGSIVMMRILLREYLNDREYDFSMEKLLGNPEIVHFFNLFWASLSEETQNELYKNPKYVNEILLKSRSKNEDGEWFCDAITEYLRVLNANKSVRFPEKVEELLSWQELSIFKLLEGKKGQTVDREQIAKTLWGDDWTEKYSEWMIEKVISNIRKKISVIPELNIKTVPKQGYCLL